MRVCHVLEAAGGGSGQVVIDLARAGVAEGDDITIVYARNRAEPSFVKSVEALSDVKIVETPMRRRLGPLDLLDAWRLYRRLRQTGPFDVVHGHSSKAGALVRLTGFGMPRTRKIYTPHCFATMDPTASPIYLHFEKFLSWLSDGIIVASNYERDHAVRRIGIQEDKINLIANGIANTVVIDRAPARRELGYQDRDFVLGFIGRLTPQKNPLRLIDAFSIAQRKHPSLKLAIVGDGPLRANVEKRAKLRRVTEQIRCFGHKPGRSVVAGFDALICSSDYEGFPIVFLEALAAGVPIVTTPVGGARECVAQGQTGFIAGGLSSEKMAQAILQLTNLTSENRLRMSASCRMHVQRFGASSTAGATRDLYMRLVQTKGSFGTFRESDASA
jgi:glycosyltransferase involved in cell wall biosynthesis